MAVPKSAEAFRTISEAAAEIDVPQHVLRHWEDVFGQIRPMRRAGGRRYYRPFDLDVLRGVRALLYRERYTTKGVQKIFREQGVKYVADIGRAAASGSLTDLRPLLDEDAEDRAFGALRDLESLGAPALSPADLEAIPEPVRSRLALLLARLERAAEALDEATLAMEAIDAEDD